MVSVNEIEKFLDKYFEGRTSISEEKKLRTYFSQKEVAPHLITYQPLFNYFNNAMNEQCYKEVKKIPLKKPSRKIVYLKRASVAAVAVILMSVFVKKYILNNSVNSFTEEELRSTQLALGLFVDNFNKGTSGASYLKEFEKNTSRFLVNNKYHK